MQKVKQNNTQKTCLTTHFYSSTVTLSFGSSPSEIRMDGTGLRAGRQRLGWAERDSGLAVRGSDGQNGTPGWTSEARMDGTGLRASRQKLGWTERDSGLAVRGSDGRNGTPGWPSEARMGGTGLRAGRQKLGWAERKTSLRSKKRSQEWLRFSVCMA